MAVSVPTAAALRGVPGAEERGARPGPTPDDERHRRGGGQRGEQRGPQRRGAACSAATAAAVSGPERATTTGPGRTQ